MSWEDDVEAAALTYNTMIHLDKDKITLGSQVEAFVAGADWQRKRLLKALDEIEPTLRTGNLTGKRYEEVTDIIRHAIETLYEHRDLCRDDKGTTR